MEDFKSPFGDEEEAPAAAAAAATNAMQKKEPNAPKKNMSAFFLYSNGNMARIKEEHPSFTVDQVVSSSLWCYRPCSHLTRVCIVRTTCVEDPFELLFVVESGAEWCVCVLGVRFTRESV